ncbi:MAG: hypothetical protein IJ193_01065 [Bacilli bacterium]|nr:hypothetical protein [Bacilli bacterium]
MQYIFLLNTFSLKKNVSMLEEKITKYCIEKQYEFVIEKNSIEVSTEDILKKYEHSHCILVAVGGDGTICRVLNGMVHTNNILSYIPYGTGNDFYRANKELLKDGLNDIDLVRVNDRYFINVACFGIDAVIGNHNEVIHSKWIPEKQRYNVSMVHHFFHYQPRNFEVRIGKRRYHGDFTTIAICNGRYYGGGYKIGYSSLLDDGLIDVYLAPKLTKWQTVKMMLGMNKGKLEHHSKIQKVSTNKLKITSKNDVSINLDGEEYIHHSFDVELIPKGICIYYDSDMIKRIGKK